MNKMRKIIYVSILILANYCGKSQAIENSSIKIENLTANEKDGKLFVNWAIDGKTEPNYVEVQRSDDGKTFKTIGLVMGPDPSQAGDKYAYVQKMKKETNTLVFYRLRCVTSEGGEQLSEIILAAK
jgi:hypothetical protein